MRIYFFLLNGSESIGWTEAVNPKTLDEGLGSLLAVTPALQQGIYYKRGEKLLTSNLGYSTRNCRSTHWDRKSANGKRRLAAPVKDLVTDHNRSGSCNGASVVTFQQRGWSHGIESICTCSERNERAGAVAPSKVAFL